MKQEHHNKSLALAQAMCGAYGWTIPNFVLQKSIYIADMIHAGETGKPITPEEFQAWDYGPVLPSVYARAHIFGNNPIKKGIFPDDDILDEREIKTVKDVATVLQKYTPGQLVNITHSQCGAWAMFYCPGIRSIAIPKKAELDEYERRLRQNKQTTGSL